MSGALFDSERVVLVDYNDVQLGVAPKQRVHETGELHRAVSVFLFDRDGRLLLQRRALGKYHSPGLWSNTCCGHPRPGETPTEAARRRLREEMGVDCQVEPRGVITYRASLGQDLIEHEVDHLFVGWFDGDPQPDTNEVGAWRWSTLDALREECAAEPERFTPWLTLALGALRTDAR